MTYRDDHDALHARVQELERDLQKAEQEASEGHEAKHRAEELARLLARAQKELERLRRPAAPAPRRAAPVLIAVSLLAVAGGVGVFLMVRGSGSDERAAAQAQAEAEAARARATEEARRIEEQVKKQAAGLEEERRRAAAAKAKLEAELARALTRRPATPSLALKVKYPPGRAVWPAKLQSATGLRVKAPCRLVVEVVEEGIDRVELTCGEKVLYSSKDPLNGMSMGSRKLELVNRRLKLHYVDQGMRTGKRSQVAVNTPEKRVEVWRDADPAFRVRLGVSPFSNPLSTPPAEAAP